MKLALFLFVAPLVAPAVAQDDEAAERATATTKEIVKTLQACQERVVVAKFESGWAKWAWGPPAQVKYDVERTNSIIYPYTATVEFSVPAKYSKSHKKKEEAEADAQLRPLLSSRYRNIYKITKDGKLLLDSVQVVGVKSGQWERRLVWNDACWDKLP
jgi:hypothetical protein